MNRFPFIFPAVLSMGLFLSACTTSPTSGQPIFTMMNTQQEAQMGAEGRGSILREYHGVMNHPELNAFVQKVGAKLIPYAERKDVTFTFTVLDTDIVNAFATPGGYVYITRGLLNLAQDESQVAAVLGHEMGHINARHNAQQQSQTMVANLGLQVLDLTLGNPIASQAGSLGSELIITKYSRSHELEADALAVRYLTAAGYDPYANTKFLALLEENTQLEQRMSGSQGGDALAAFFQTHPPTPERVVRARELADQAPKHPNPIVNRVEYLRAVDGNVYGDTAAQGFARGRVFIHPKLKIKFELPPGFHIDNTDKQVVALSPSGAMVIFDTGRGEVDDPVDYITTKWQTNILATNQERISINGFSAATAATTLQYDGSSRDAQIVAIAAGDRKFFRLIFLAPSGHMPQYAHDFRRTTYSFAKLTPQELKLASPNRVRLIRVKPGDTIASLAAQMPVADYAVERFCLLNGLQSGDQLVPGEMIKTVATF